MSSRARARRPLADALAAFTVAGWEPVLFGGLLRDLMMTQGVVKPRDVDVVLAAGDMEAVARASGSDVRRQTRFGGLVLNVSGWRLDVWSLEATWAFRAGLVAPVTVSELPRTTFLDVEAVAVELPRRRGTRWRVHTAGFFQAIEARVVEVNLAENPFPQLCVVRALITAARLDFAIGSRLAGYILEHAHDEDDLLPLIAVQAQHYGVVRRTAEELGRWLRALRAHHRRTPRQPFHLPSTAPLQLGVWESANWSLAPDPEAAAAALSDQSDTVSGLARHS